MAFLIVRPQGKAQQTVAHFEQHLLQAQALPILNIALSDDRLILETLNHAQPQCVIVTSTYAAQWLLNVADICTVNLSQVFFVCVGASTANLLKTITSSSRLFVAVPENSEGLVMHAHLQNVNKKPIVILKGEGGRDLIARTLNERGAIVSTLNVYKREVNKHAIDAFTFEASSIKCIIVTSIEIVQLLLANMNQQWLTSCKWIVASQRIKDYACTHGIQNIMVSEGASNDALLACATQSVNTGVAHD